MLGGGVAAGLGGEFLLLELDVGAHAFTGVTVGEVEHRVVQGVEAGQSDELEREAHGTEFALELGDRGVVQVLAPVEGRGAVVGEHLVRELGLDRFGELAGQLQVRGAGLHPDEVGIRCVGLGAGDAGFDAVADFVEALSGTFTGDEFLVPLVNVGGDQGCCFGVGAGDDHRRGAGDVGCQAGCVQGPDVLLGGDQHLAAQVAALLFRSELVFPVNARGTCGNHGFHKLVGVQRATKACFGVRDDRDQPVFDGLDAFGILDLVCAEQRVVDAADNLRHRVGRVQGLVRVGLARQVGVGGHLPAGEVDGAEAGLDLLHSLVTGQCAQGVGVAAGGSFLGELLPKLLGTATGQGVLFGDAATEADDVGSRVITGDAFPPRVGGPFKFQRCCLLFESEL
ncbi:hypothetical protein CVCC1112_4560 [Paenarthrobacter nicotinovorans]|nr:hypothetical protein CVCC1112_4560 [Paenarthrobacter nicotinovorans]